MVPLLLFYWALPKFVTLCRLLHDVLMSWSRDAMEMLARFLKHWVAILN